MEENLYKKAVKPALLAKANSLEYQEMLKDMEGYQKLYKFWMLENVTDYYRLCDLVGARFVGDIAHMVAVLKSYIKGVFGGQFDRHTVVTKMCPNCFQPSLTAASLRGGGKKSKLPVAIPVAVLSLTSLLGIFKISANSSTAT